MMTVRLVGSIILLDKYRRKADKKPDLIEPKRTCHYVIEDETAVCSECGEDIDGYGWTYCPNCGSKIVEEGGGNERL